MGNIDHSMVTDYWKSAPDEVILGASYIVTKEGNYIAYDLPASFAEHIVTIHNQWWDARVWESYYDNIMAGIALEIANYYDGHEAPLPDGVVALTEQELKDYTAEHEEA